MMLLRPGLSLAAVAFAFSLCSAASSKERPIHEEPSLATVFAEAGVEGCFVLYDPRREVLRLHNPDRARERLLPASTFKIANALVALETGAVGDVDELIPYGGTEELFESWERDMTLREAMRASNVAVFHQVAKRVGQERMARWLTAFGYGNGEVGYDGERRYWLEGPLAISAVEQVIFIQRLNEDGLGVARRSREALKEIVEHSRSSEAAIFGKTGWGGPDHPRTGWWVGWLEKEGQVFPFALNIDTPSLDAARRRIPVGLSCLAALGVFDESAEEESGRVSRTK